MGKIKKRIRSLFINRPVAYHLAKKLLFLSVFMVSMLVYCLIPRTGKAADSAVSQHCSFVSGGERTASYHTRVLPGTYDCPENQRLHPNLLSGIL